MSLLEHGGNRFVHSLYFLLCGASDSEEAPAARFELASPFGRQLSRHEHGKSNGQRPSVDWVEFEARLDAQYSARHARQLFLRATKYQAAAFDADKAAQLKAVSKDSRRYVMESLAALSKLTGTCEKWQAVKLQSGHYRHRSLRLSRYFLPRT
jgi:hypothetical protein